MNKPSAIVIGVGSKAGLGAALSQRFAREGYHVFVVGRTGSKLADVVDDIRNNGGSAEAFEGDATREDDINRLFAYAFTPEKGIDAPDLVVFNTGANRPVSFLELEAADFEYFWRVGCYAGFLAGREAASHMAPLGRGTILFTGASASLRGKPNFAHFAAAKAGLRAISQSMAREFGPKGLHVAHVVIDGGIDGEIMHSKWPDMVKAKGENGLLGLEAIADSYWHLHRQHQSAWTQEIDLRPFKEAF